MSREARAVDPPAFMTADRIGGLIWLVFGAAVVYGSWTMDRLESLGINPVTAPGLLPGLLGLGFIGFGLVLLLRRGEPRLVGEAPAETGAIETDAVETGTPQLGVAEGGEDWRRLALSWALCVVFAGGLLGRGLPFWLLAAVFVFLHILLLDDADRIAATPLPRRIATAVVVAVATAAAVTFVFQNLFLIRLP